MMRVFYLILTLVLCNVFASIAQEKQHLLFRIIDAESAEPVPYATIQFANNKSGVVANILGDFRIPISYQKKEDILIISCIGYRNKRLILKSLTEKEYHTIYLSPKTEELKEVVLKATETKGKKKLSAKEIVEKAIEKIKDNYPVEPFSYIAYYRDYQSVEDKYINLNESIVEVFDQGFLSHKIKDSLNATALYRYQLNKEFPQDPLLSNSIYNDAKQIRDGQMGSSIGNELTLLDIHNPIRNYNTGSFSFVYILERDFVKNHKFYNKGFVFSDNEALFKIKFSAKEDVTGSAYNAEGYIYISKDDFSIHKFDYQLFSEYPRKLIFTVNIEYKRRENYKMYLNYITFNNNFFITPMAALKVENWNYDKEKGSFFIEFNRDLDAQSIKKLSNVKIYFKNKKLAIRYMYFVTSKMIGVKLKIEESDFLNQQNLDDKAFMSFRFKNFLSSQGFEMGKSKVEGYQFRELFIQRVFQRKELDTNLFYIDKGKSLTDALLNNFRNENYWLNTPLKTIIN